MKSLTNGNPRSADGTPTVGALLSSDAGAISSAAEGAVESGVGGDRDRVNGDATLQTTASETGSPLGLQRKSLRVTFPEFEVVSGYMDPPRPWNDVSQCSTDELITSYLNACNKVGVKPNARLLSQLQVITNFDDRNETLILKNENLDARHCETLEEVFRRVQFRTIDLEATKLEEEGAVTIFDMIEYYESCMKLNISYSKNLGQRGWQACSRMIRKTSCLENLEARGTVLSDFVMPILGRSLRVSSSLSSLHLEFAVTSGRPLQVLVAALKVNETLKELYLADNKLMPSDGIQLGSLLRYNRTLHLLDLRNNHLQDTGFQHICEGVWEQGKGNGLNTLVIWNNQLSYHAMNHLSKALFNSTSLETINLGHNNLTSEGMHRLKESLLQNKTLLRIGLQAAKITCEGAVALAEFIAESINLVRLDLRENDIKTGGLMALSLALRVSQSVTRIDLDKEPKKDSGMKDYAEQQKRLLNDITTYMQRNRMLARQREEEENSRESERPSSPKPDEQTLSSSEEKRNGEEEAEEGEVTSCEEVSCREDEGVVALDDLKECGSLSAGDSNSRHRMNLTLELKTRCEMLESPDFVPESEMPATDLSAPDAAAAAPTPPGTRVTKCKVPVDIPPSPMVSAQGKTFLVPVLDGPLSPGFEEEALSGGGTKSEDVPVGSSCHSGSQDHSSAAVSETDRLPTGKASEFWDKPVSPLSSLGSNLPISSIDKNGAIPLSANSYPSALDSSPTRLQNKKSSLKMTRPRHRFQVSKVNLAHKLGGRRGSGGSHKNLHMTTEHSRREAAQTPSLMASLSAFQSTIAVPLAVDSRISKVSSDAVAPSGSVGEKDSAGFRDRGNFPIAGKQNQFQVGSLPNSSTESHSTSQDVALHSYCVSPSECNAADLPHSCRAEQDGPPRATSDQENATASNISEIQPSPPSSNEEVFVDNGPSIIPVPECTAAINAKDVEPLPTVDQVGEAMSTSRAARDDVISIVRDETNDPVEHQVQRRNNLNSLHILNGVNCDFPDNAVDLENFGDGSAHKLHAEKAQSNSEQSVV